MANKQNRDKQLIRKGVLIGSVIGIVFMLILFFVVSFGDWTAEKIAWLCVNSTCAGVIVGGGIGYILTDKYIDFG